MIKNKRLFRTPGMLGLALLASSALTAQAQIPEPLAFYDFEAADDTTVPDASGNGYDGEINGDVEISEGAPGTVSPGAGGQFSGGFLDAFDFDWGELVHADGDDRLGSYTLSCWLKPDIESIGGDHFIWGQSTQGIHNGLRASGTLHTAHWGSDFNADTILTEDEWVQAVWTYDGDLGEANIYLNGELDGGPFGQNPPDQGGTLIIGGRNGGTENYIGALDELAIWNEVLSEDQIGLLAAGESPIGGTLQDTDGDGMPDDYEDKFDFLDPENAADAALDQDEDTLTNLAEYNLRTAPDKKDTDEDGLDDPIESNSGTFVDATDTGTSPTKPDTDKDGLLDGVETNTGIFVGPADTGTNPLLADTDGDRRKDGKEVEDGTNPLDASDPPPPDPTNIVSGYWPLDADLLDASGNGGDGTLVDGDDDIPDFVEGKLGSALSLDGISEFVEINPDLADLYSGYDVENGEPNPSGFSVSAWFKVGVWDKTWQCLVAKGEGNNWRVHRRGGETTITGNGGNGDVPNSALVEPEDDEWHFLILVSNPELDLAQLWVDGQLEGENSGLALVNGGLPMMIGENPGARNRTWNGLIDDVAFFNRALTEDEHMQLWNDGEGATVDEVFLGGGSPLGFRITNIEILEAEGETPKRVRVTWASRDNQFYAVDTSTTIPVSVDDWEEAADGVDSGGEETSFTINLTNNNDVAELYIRVRVEQ